MNASESSQCRPFFAALVIRLRVVVDAPGRESGAALLTTMLFMIMLAGLSLVMLSVLLGQIQPALAAQQSTRSVYSAQAGLQAALGAIRTAAGSANATGEVYGSLSELPCSVSGAVDGADDEISYEVTVRYYASNPAGQSASWLANSIPCTAAGGVATQPRFAVVRSQGAPTAEDGSLIDEGDRTIEAIYQFNISNVNIPGGRMFNVSQTHCIQAVTAAAGSKVLYQPAAQCTGTAREQWIYGADWRIKLASTTVNGQTPLCVTGPVNATDTNSQDILLRPCLLDDDPNRWNQLFSWDGGEIFRGQRPNITGGVSSYCLGPESTTLSGTDLQAKAGGCGASSGWSPTAQVGAGAASYDTKQIVNFREFGRCADVTDQDPGKAFMIVYPCKQDASGSGNGINWNHKWTYTEPANLQGSLSGQISILFNNNANDRRCLTTPANNPASKYVVFSTCNGNQARQQWTRVAQAATYAQSWLFIDSNGRCLTADSSDLYRGLFSKMTVATCNDTETQKWNAPANSASATFGGYREVVG